MLNDMLFPSPTEHDRVKCNGINHVQSLTVLMQLFPLQATSHKDSSEAVVYGIPSGLLGSAS